MNVQSLLEKAVNGERLSAEEGLFLYREADLLDLGMAADAIRQRLVPGNLVTYLVDRNVNYSNVCTTNCQFCGFYRPLGHPESYVQTYEEIGARLAELVEYGGTRVLMQGGHHPELRLSWYTGLLSYLREHYPSIELDCFSPSEIDNLAKVENMSIREVLVALKAAGLAGVPGGGAEILDDEVRQRVSPLKQDAAGWLEVQGTAQSLGMATTATMVIGFGESLEQRMNHLIKLRDLQDVSLREYNNGFIAFISWTVQKSELTSLGRSKFSDDYGATAAEYLRHTALARIMLDNFNHIQASWVTQGPKIGQVSLKFGIDDFGSTMLEENVVSNAAHDTYQCMGEREIHGFIRDAGFIPAKRDTHYNLIQAFEDPKDSESVPSMGIKQPRQAKQVEIPLMVK
ncbi:MAG: dehypoxanthine futalosine cyclase [Chloroflexi bacterium]|nr:dehypoxanthine futalosine cyclase [Chloroflexota bacterium]